MGDFGIKWFPNFDDGFKYHTIDTPEKELPFRTTWRSYPIPGIWSVKLLTNVFWKYEVQKFSQGALFFPKCFRAREHRLDSFGSHHFEVRTYSAQFRAPFKNDGGMNKLNELIISKRNETAALRPWYWNAYYRWQVTPYSMPITRWYLNQVHRWMLNADEWNEYRIQELIQFWGWKLPSFNGAPLGWFYSAVADLLAASLPVRQHNVTIPGQQKDWKHEAFIHVKGSNASNPVHVREAQDSLSRGHTKRREFELRARSIEYRRDHFLRAWNKFDFYFQSRPHHSGLRTAFTGIMRFIWNNIDNPDRAHRYWRFALPPYSDDLIGTNWEHPETRQIVWKDAQRAKGLEFQTVGAVEIRPPMLVQFAASVADAEENLMAELPKGLRASNFEDRVDEPRNDPRTVSWPTSAAFPLGSMRRVRAAESLPTFRYFSIGEIADHAKPADLWVIEEEGDELAIYDVSGEQ